jgi:hypothetical protein
MQRLYGPFEYLQFTIESSKNYNTIVMGPWSHGDWARNSTKQVIGNINLETVFLVLSKKT